MRTFSPGRRLCHRRLAAGRRAAWIRAPSSGFTVAEESRAESAAGRFKRARPDSTLASRTGVRSASPHGPAEAGHYAERRRLPGKTSANNPYRKSAMLRAHRCCSVRLQPDRDTETPSDRSAGLVTDVLLGLRGRSARRSRHTSPDTRGAALPCRFRRRAPGPDCRARAGMRDRATRTAWCR